MKKCDINKILVAICLFSTSLVSPSYGSQGGSNPAMCRQCAMPGNLKNWTNKAHPNCAICYAACTTVGKNNPNLLEIAKRYALCASQLAPVVPETIVPQPQQPKPQPDLVVLQPQQPKPQSELVVPQQQQPKPQSELVVPQPQQPKPQPELVVPQPQQPKPQPELVVPQQQQPKPQSELVVPQPLSQPPLTEEEEIWMELKPIIQLSQKIKNKINNGQPVGIEEARELARSKLPQRLLINKKFNLTNFISAQRSLQTKIDENAPYLDGAKAVCDALAELLAFIHLTPPELHGLEAAPILRGPGMEKLLAEAQTIADDYASLAALLKKEAPDLVVTSERLYKAEVPKKAIVGIPLEIPASLTPVEILNNPAGFRELTINIAEKTHELKGVGRYNQEPELHGLEAAPILRGPGMEKLLAEARKLADDYASLNEEIRKAPKLQIVPKTGPAVKPSLIEVPEVMIEEVPARVIAEQLWKKLIVEEGIKLSEVSELGQKKPAFTIKEELLNTLTVFLEDQRNIVNDTQVHAELERYIKVRNEIDAKLEDRFGKEGINGFDRINALDFLKRNPSSTFDQIQEHVDHIKGNPVLPHHGLIEPLKPEVKHERKIEEVPEMSDVTKEVLEEALRPEVRKELEWGDIDETEREKIVSEIDGVMTRVTKSGGRRSFNYVYEILMRKFPGKFTPEIFWDILGELDLQDKVDLTQEQQAKFKRNLPASQIQLPVAVKAEPLASIGSKSVITDAMKNDIISYIRDEPKKVKFNKILKTFSDAYKINYPAQDLVRLIQENQLTDKVLEIPPVAVNVRPASQVRPPVGVNEAEAHKHTAEIYGEYEEQRNKLMAETLTEELKDRMTSLEKIISDPTFTPDTKNIEIAKNLYENVVNLSNRLLPILDDTSRQSLINRLAKLKISYDDEKNIFSWAGL